MDGSLQIVRCATEGCNSILTNPNKEYCLLHSELMPRSRVVHTRSNDTSSSITFSRPCKAPTIKEPHGPSNTSAAEQESKGGQPQNGLGTFPDSRGSIANLSTVPRQTVRRTNFPPDLLNKHAMTARKSIGGNTRSQTKSPATLSHSLKPSFSPGQTSLSTFSSQLSGSPDEVLFKKVAQNGVRQNTGPVMNGQSQRKPLTGNSEASRANSRSARPVSQDFEASTSSAKTQGASSSRITGAIQNKPKEQAKSSVPSPVPNGTRNFRSLPYVRTSFRPPTSIKSAPVVPRSASKHRRKTSHNKRKRNSDLESNSTLSSSDEIDEEDHPQSQSTTTISRAQGFALDGGLAQIDSNSTVSNIHNFIPDRVGSPAFSSRNSFLVSERERLYEEPDEYSEAEGRLLPIYEQSHHRLHAAQTELSSAHNQQLPLGIDSQWRPKAPLPNAMSCEQRRLQLSATFDASKFDAMLYGQPEAARPPPGVFVPTAPAYHQSASAVAENRQPFYMRLDPRIHWSHDRSEQWYERKMEEIKARAGRKANFGKAAQRMRQQRIAEEKRAAAEAEEAAAAAKQGRELPPPDNPCKPWSHHRHMDFGDVPEDELPSYVCKNEAWLRATAWMRENREKNLQKNKEAATLQAANESWGHLFPKSKHGR